MSNELNIILGIFGKYNIQYDLVNKIIIIRKPIHPRDFHFLLKYFKTLKDEIRDIRVIDYYRRRY